MSEWPYPAPEDDGGAKHLVAGTALPDIALLSTDGGYVTLARIAGWAIVFIYPWTGAPGVANPPDWDVIPGAHGSTPEAEGFRDHHAGFADKDFKVFGLSGQASAVQREFFARKALSFPLLSDDGLAWSRALRLPAFETGGVRYLKRITLVVRDGKVVRAVYPVHPPDTHARDLLAQL